MWIVWLLSSTFMVGYIAGAITRIIIDHRRFRQEQAAIRAKQAYIRQLMEERKSLLWQNRIGREL